MRIAAGLRLLLALALLALLLAGCSLFKPAVDPFAEYRQGWRADFTISAAQFDALPVYSMTVRIDPQDKASYAGILELTLPVTGTAPLNELYFRTYPNLYAFGGNLQVTGASVNGTTANFGPAAEGAAVHLTVPKPLEIGTRARVWLAFSGSVERESKPGEYTIFGTNEDVLSLTNFYPILAGRRGDEWALDIPHPQGDVGFHDAALYRVEITTPADQVLVATGTEADADRGRGRLGHGAVCCGPGAGVYGAPQPALSDDRGRDVGHPCAFVLLSGRCRCRPRGVVRRGGGVADLQ